jgi:hypothetical protein
MVSAEHLGVNCEEFRCGAEELTGKPSQKTGRSRKTGEADDHGAARPKTGSGSRRKRGKR